MKKTEAISEKTTVNLFDTAQAIKNKLTPVFGLKNILSAGLVLFDQLSDAEQKKIIARMVEASQKADAEVQKQKQAKKREESA